MRLLTDKIRRIGASAKRVTASLVVMLLTLTGCIEPPLYLPADEVLVDMPIVVMDLEVVWNVDVDWQSHWYYGWDALDESLFGSIEYPQPRSYEVRRYFVGDDKTAPHTAAGTDGFTTMQTSFRKSYNFGYYDLLLWSNIYSPTGTQVVLIDESNLEEVKASTTATRGIMRDISAQAVTGLYNQPEIFYSAYEEEVYISRYHEDYDYFDEQEQVCVKHIQTTLNPLVYIYLVQVIVHNNDGRIVGVTGDAAVSAFANGTSVNTAHTNNSPCMVYFPMRFKQGIDADGETVDIAGGKLTTYGLCDMDGWATDTRADYNGTRTDLDNKLFLTLQFSNGTEKTLDFLITDQCRARAHGGVLTVHINALDIKPPSSGEQGSGNLFVPNVEDYENVDYDIIL